MVSELATVATSMVRPRIAHVVWLSVSALVMGYAVSIGVVIAIAWQTNRDMSTQPNGTFPAAIVARISERLA